MILANADPRPQPPRSGWLVRTTPAGRKAREVLEPQFADVETRWRERFGTDGIGDLRDGLSAVVDQFSVELPDCLPILHYGMFSKAPDHEPRTPLQGEESGFSSLPLPALLSRVLLAFTVSTKAVRRVVWGRRQPLAGP